MLVCWICVICTPDVRIVIIYTAGLSYTSGDKNTTNSSAMRISDVGLTFLYTSGNLQEFVHAKKSFSVLRAHM